MSHIIMRVETAKEHAHREVASHCSRNDCKRAKSALAEMEKLVLHLNSQNKVMKRSSMNPIAASQHPEPPAAEQPTSDNHFSHAH